MKTVTQELKKQKRRQKVSSKKIKKSKISKPKDVRKILENKEKNDLKVQKYMKLLKKFDKIIDQNERDELKKKYEEKYGRFTMNVIDIAKKKYKEKLEEKGIDDEEELRLLKIYRKTEKYINLLRKIESTKDPMKQIELRRQFEEEYGDEDLKIKISKEDFGEEDKNIRNFLISVNEIAKDYKKDDVDKQDIIENVIDMIENFSEEENLNSFFSQKRKKIFEKITNNFGFKMMIKFIEAFLEQQNDLENFYIDYVNRPEIRKKINKFKYGEPKKSDTDNKKESVPKKTFSKIIYEDEIVDKKCLELYITTPWLSFRVKKLYVTFVDPTTLEDISEYIMKDTTPLQYKDSNWYQTNRNIYKLLCSAPLFEKSQNNDVLTIKNLNIKLGYKIDLFDNSKTKELNDDNFIIQNEEMFESEKNYIKNYNLSLKEKINKIIDEKEISEDIIKIAKNELSNSLKRVSNYDEFYSENSDFVNKVINSLISSSSNVKTFLEKLANIIVYLSYDIENVSHKIFSNRIKAKYYVPEILVLLSPEEKLPEILGNDDISETRKENFAKTINIKIEIFIQNLLRAIYTIRNPYEHNPTISSKYFSHYIDKIPIKDWKDKCENYEDIKNVPNENLLYYDEKGVTYCLNIRQIWENFKNKNYKNPYTKKKLSKEFINNFNKTYNIVEEVEEEVEEETEDKYVEVEEELTPDLIKLIENDLNIEYLEEEPEKVVEEPDKEDERIYSISLKELDPKIDDLYERITNTGVNINRAQVLKLLQKNNYDVDASEEYYNSSEEVQNKIKEEYNKPKNETSKIDFEEFEESENEESENEESDNEERYNKNKSEKKDFDSENEYDKDENEDEDESYKPTDNSLESNDKISSKGDPIRGDLPIVDTKTGWDKPNDKKAYKPTSKKSEIEKEKKCKYCLKVCKNKFYKSFVGKKLNYFCSLKCMENYKF